MPNVIANEIWFRLGKSAPWIFGILAIASIYYTAGWIDTPASAREVDHLTDRVAVIEQSSVDVMADLEEIRIQSALTMQKLDLLQKGQDQLLIIMLQQSSDR